MAWRFRSFKVNSRSKVQRFPFLYSQFEKTVRRLPPVVHIGKAPIAYRRRLCRAQTGSFLPSGFLAMKSIEVVARSSIEKH